MPTTATPRCFSRPAHRTDQSAAPRIVIGRCGCGSRGPRSRTLVSTMDPPAVGVASLRRYMDQLRVTNGNDDGIRYPVQEESVQCVFEMVADLVSKRGDWKNWDWKEDFGSSLTIDDLVRTRQALFTPDELDEDRMTEAHKAASKGYENVVAFAVYVAQNVDTLNHADDAREDTSYITPSAVVRRSFVVWRLSKDATKALRMCGAIRRYTSQPVTGGPTISKPC